MPLFVGSSKLGQLEDICLSIFKECIIWMGFSGSFSTCTSGRIHCWSCLIMRRAFFFRGRYEDNLYLNGTSSFLRLKILQLGSLGSFINGTSSSMRLKILQLGSLGSFMAPMAGRMQVTPVTRSFMSPVLTGH